MEEAIVVGSCILQLLSAKDDAINDTLDKNEQNGDKFMMTKPL